MGSPDSTVDHLSIVKLTQVTAITESQKSTAKSSGRRGKVSGTSVKVQAEVRNSPACFGR